MEVASWLVYCLYVLAVSVGLVIGLFGAVYYHSPHLLMSAMNKYAVLQSGFDKRTVSNDEYTFAYLERGRRRAGSPSFLFLHGIMSTKDIWVTCFKGMPTDDHIILMDLPGHGETTEKDDDDVSNLGMMGRVKQFVDLVGLSEAPFHICGHSMGASIAGLYAYQYPQDVNLLTVICPTIKTPELTEVGRRIEAGMSPMVMQNLEDVRWLMDQFTYKKLHFTKQMLKGVVEMMTRKKHFYEKVINAMTLTESSKQLQLHMHDIHTPSQIVWGANDQMMHVSGLAALKTGLAGCVDAVSISECGHNLHFDRPDQLISSLVRFRETQLAARVKQAGMAADVQTTRSVSAAVPGLTTPLLSQSLIDAVNTS